MTGAVVVVNTWGRRLFGPALEVGVHAAVNSATTHPERIADRLTLASTSTSLSLAETEVVGTHQPHLDIEGNRGRTS